jgi:DNA-binding IclR family transcriptional regulator
MENKIKHRIKRILELLRKHELTVPEIAKKTGMSADIVYRLMYMLESESRVERIRWEGAWVWGIKQK